MSKRHALERHFDWCRNSLVEARTALARYEGGQMKFYSNRVDTTEEAMASLRRVIENLESHLREQDEPLE